MAKRLTAFGLTIMILLCLPFASFSHANAKAYTNSKKVVYLTFDDGPNLESQKILDILKKKNIKATFFLIEPQIRHYPKTTQRMLREGHSLGLHSVTHNAKKLYYGNPANVAKEMEKTRLTLKKITKLDSHLIRVPYGSKPYMKQSFRNELVKKHFKMWDWNIDSEDWKYDTKNPAKIVSNVKSGLKGKSGPIVILFHCKKGTVQKLPEMIDYLRKKGYTFKAYDPKHHFEMNFWNDKRL